MDENNKIELIFTEQDIEIISNSLNAVNVIYEKLEKNMKKKGILDIDTNALITVSEFHLNNLIYLNDNFNFPISVKSKLLNLFAILLNLRNEKNENPDFNIICKNKLNEIKNGLISLKLIYTQENKATNFCLKSEEITNILDYINTFYFPYIRLYYHFINIERITEYKRIEVIVNKPLIVPPLNNAVEQIQERNQIDKEIVEEPEDEDNKEDKQENKPKEEKKDEVTSFVNIMNELNMNENIKNIIKDRVEELHRDIEFKIKTRQSILDEKLKEVEESLKKKK